MVGKTLGHYEIEIWKRQADGSWKVAADMFSPDSPSASPF